MIAGGDRLAAPTAEAGEHRIGFGQGGVVAALGTIPLPSSQAVVVGAGQRCRCSSGSRSSPPDATIGAEPDGEALWFRCATG